MALSSSSGGGGGGARVSVVCKTGVCKAGDDPAGTEMKEGGTVVATADGISRLLLAC